MAQLDKLDNDTREWLDGKRMGGPLGADYEKNREVQLGTRLDELAKIRVGSVTIAGTDVTGTVAFGADFANAKCIGSISTDSDDTAVLAKVSNASAAGVCTVTLSTAPGADESCVVNVWADAR